MISVHQVHRHNVSKMSVSHSLELYPFSYIYFTYPSWLANFYWFNFMLFTVLSVWDFRISYFCLVLPLRHPCSACISILLKSTTSNSQYLLSQTWCCSRDLSILRFSKNSPTAISPKWNICELLLDIFLLFSLQLSREVSMWVLFWNTVCYFVDSMKQ